MKSRLDVLRGIQAVGYLREIDLTEMFNLTQLTIETNCTNSMVFALPMGTAIVIHLRLSAKRGMYVQEFGSLELAGATWDVDWWVQDKTEPLYIVYHGLDYPRDAVLNHCIGRQGRVTPGIPREGYLLGRSRNAVPMNLRDFELPAKLTIYDGAQDWEHEFSIRFDHEFRPVRKPYKSSLFEGGKCPDEYRWVIEEGHEHQAQDFDYGSVKDPAAVKLTVAPKPASVPRSKSSGL